jgi:hypothetical protein
MKTCAQTSPKLSDFRMRSTTCWRRTLILLAVVSLSISVATRYCAVVQSSLEATTLVKACPIDGKRQHLLNDGLHWSAPIATFVLLEPARASGAVLAVVPLFTRLYVEDSLYSRPPPVC